jgi:hypothetical protein
MTSLECGNSSPSLRSQRIDQNAVVQASCRIANIIS